MPANSEAFSRLTGVRYPWGRYAQVTAADFIGGMIDIGPEEKQALLETFDLKARLDKLLVQAVPGLGLTINEKGLKRC